MPRTVHPPKKQLDKLRQPLTSGEKMVLDFLDRKLDKQWEIYIQPHLNGLRPDFVLLNPAFGIGVIEVKDWNLDAMHYFIKTHPSGFNELYARNELREFAVENPFTKIKKYKQEIFDVYCPRLQKKAGFAAICPIVIFPFAARYRVMALQESFLDKRAIENRSEWFPVAGREDLANGRLEAILPLLNRSDCPMTPALADDLRGWLVEPDFASTQRQPLILDKSQRTLAETRTSSGYRRIKGPAGSGKSLVLAARAAKLASEGKSVLFVTFNMTLWHYLRDLVARGVTRQDWMQNITFVHFHQWCKRVCEHPAYLKRYAMIMAPIKKIADDESLNDKEKKRRISAIATPILEDQVPRLALEAARSQDSKFDAVLVDEGQDFLPLWWNALRGVRNDDDAEMVLVADATQDVYGKAISWTEDAMSGAGFKGEWARLKLGYRSPSNSVRLASDFAKHFLPPEACDLPQPAQGNLELDESTVEWIQCDKQSAVRSCVDAVLAMHRKTGNQGLANADIVFLCDSIDHGLEFIKELTTYDAFRISVAHTYAHNKGEESRRKMAFWLGDARMKATTFHSFKGWETRLLVIYIANARGRENRSAIYAALTRLKRSELGSHLTVVCSAPELAAFGAKYAEAENRSVAG
ncbi:NERD domain-containing protein/DEAD/DEAH box helicase [Erythrobacter sp. Dej080120_24]|uniref:NERD domain-containing protein/DEAD/DEAH box helicase n=1 Tax=Erythrobacter sp. Dej080120_24 TaxID=3024837 RepID=UPI0030C66BAB